jgi:3',5'-cyclic-AMP phosphodiesterase
MTDLHIKAGRRRAYGVVDTAGYLDRAVNQLIKLKPLPDALLLTGDLADHGQPQDYALLREILQPWLDLQRPTHVVMGNHDERSALQAAFANELSLPDERSFIQYAIDLAADLRLLVLDTVNAGEGGGSLCVSRLKWLEQQLRDDHRPTILAMHHPPFQSGIDHMDQVGLSKLDDFVGVVARYPQIERILCGHLHRSISVRIGSTLAMTAPSTAHQVALDFRASTPDYFVMEPPGFLLHLWRSGHLISHSCVIGDYEGPYRFRDSGKLID